MPVRYRIDKLIGIDAQQDHETLESLTVRCGGGPVIGSPQWSMRVDDQGGVLRVFLSGRFRLDEWFEVLDAMPTTPGFHTGLHTIFDGREAHFGFSSEEIQRLVMKLRDRVESRGTGFRSAFVVDEDVDYGIARMITALVDQLPFEAAAFRSVTEAESWVLGESSDAL